MTMLKLGQLIDDKPIKVTIEIPAATHQELVAYAEAFALSLGQAVPDPTKLIVPMIKRFMETDRAFAKIKRGKQI